MLRINSDAVGIKSIEHAIADRAWGEGWIQPQKAAARSGKKVAVVGSGPAGLAAAQQLARAGHDVTVFEKNDRVGGLLRYGIPDFKMEKSHIDRRVAQMEAEGVVFRTGVVVGEWPKGAKITNHAKDSVSAEQLKSEFDAVLLAAGSEVSRDLPVPGRDLDGVHFAMEFLPQQNKVNAGDKLKGQTVASGKDVIVIGGGDTGTDCVGTAIRQGARSIRQLELLGRPPVERAPNNPWPEWPKVYKLDYGQEEAEALWGEDPRRYSTTTRRFIGRNEHVTGIEIADLSWQTGADGKVAMREVPGTAQVLPADLVLLALGFLGPEPVLPKAFDCELDPRGNVRADADKMTTVPGVFAAGDCARGQSLVVWAIKEGRAAAEGVDRYLARI